MIRSGRALSVQCGLLEEQVLFFFFFFYWCILFHFCAVIPARRNTDFKLRMKTEVSLGLAPHLAHRRCSKPVSWKRATHRKGRAW